MSEEIKEKQNSFSIVIPTCERQHLVQRAIGSIQNQIYQGPFEIVVVNDGSSDDTGRVLNNLARRDKRVKVVHHKGRMQRLYARNSGIKAAKNEWLCHLDSDDEYLRTYLDSINWAINEYPEYNCFHFGAMVCGLRGYRIREPHDFKEENEFGEAMDRFRSGFIGMGSFVYKREIHDEVGVFPEVGNPYKFADAAKDEFPEMMEWFGPKYLEGGKELGNPYGDDYFLFYKITRKYKSKMLPFLTYLQYVRRSGFTVQDNDLILNRPNVVIP